MKAPCHSPEETALYERGYPYVVELIDGHKDDKKPGAIATRAFKNFWGPYHVKWPRLTAAAFARASAVACGKWGEPEVAKAASASGPVSVDEAKAIVAGWFEKPWSPTFYEALHPTIVLEAIAGTDVVLAAISDGLEKAATRPKKGKDEGSAHAYFAYLTGLLLLRASRAKDHRARLESIYDETVKQGLDEGEHTMRGGLDLALHGNQGAARTLANSHWQYWYWYLFVDDAKTHLARLADNYKSDWVPEARILFLAGTEMIPVYTTKKALRQGKRLPDILHDFGMFADDRILDLMIDMIGVKGAGEAPAEYFKERVAFVRPRLERLAKGSGANAVKAKAALALVK
jgi:hypothetical protein